MLAFFRKSLATRAAVVIGGLLAALLIVVATVGCIAYSRQQEAGLQDKMALLARLEVASLGKPLWDLDAKSVAGQLEKIQTELDLLHQRVIDSNGKTFAENGQNAVNGAATLNVPIQFMPKIGQPPKTIGSLEISYDLSRLTGELRRLQVAVAAIGAAAVAVVVLTIWLLLRRTIRPVNALARTLGQFAEGNYDADVPSLERQDEVGQIARGAAVLKETGLHKLKLERERDDANASAARARIDDANRTADLFEAKVGEMVRALSEASAELKAVAQSWSSGAEFASQRSEAVGAAANTASTNVQAVAASAEELVSSVTEISRQVTKSTTVTNRAHDEAKRTNETVRELSDSAQRIGEVVSLISNIASQTNLLALNATIEAARAGDAGKGFAVVASEVKALANQTGKATDEISGQVAQIQSATRDAVAAIQSITGTIAEVSEIASTIAAAVEEQRAATQEIAQNIQQVATGTNEVTDNIAEVSRAAQEGVQGAAKVHSATNALSHQTTALQGAVDEFLTSVRAA